MGTRARILGWYVTLLVLAAIAALLLQRRVLTDRLNEEVEEGLVQEVQELRTLSQGADPRTAEPFAGDSSPIFDTFLARNIPVEGEALVTFVDGEPYKGSVAPYHLATNEELVERWANLETVDRGEVLTPAGPARYVAVPLQYEGETTGVFVAAIFLEEEQREIEEALRYGAIAWLVVLIGASAIAWVIAGRVLAPLRDLSETARQISDTDLSRRIAVDGNDEISHLTSVFNNMLDRLEYAFYVQRAFLDDAGHELRTPITVIRGHLELMTDDPRERRETIAVVTDELDRMSRIVDDLLVLARSEQPDFLLPAPVDLDLFASNVFSRIRTLGNRDWRLDETGQGIVVIDRQRMTQVFMNLADNAVRHTKAGDVIAIGSRLEDGEVRFWVRDTGPGIPYHEQERIFQRFARIEGDRRSPGTAGLGLSIVQAIAKGHGGRVELESAPGAGARFTVIVRQDHKGGTDVADTDS